MYTDMFIQNNHTLIQIDIVISNVELILIMSGRFHDQEANGLEPKQIAFIGTDDLDYICLKKNHVQLPENIR